MAARNTIWLLLLLAIQFACTKGRYIPPPVGNTPPPGAPGPISTPSTPSQTGKTYLALGDSYTIGENVAASQRFPSLTKDWLQSNGVEMIDPRFVAGTGWTTYVLQNVIGYSNINQTYDAVSLLIGVNDQYIRTDTAEFRLRFTQVLQQSIFFAHELPSHVFVLSIPDYSVTPYASNSDTARIRREIDAYNNIVREVAIARGTRYLDITPSTRLAKDDPSLLAPDGLHPSGIEYGKWAAQLGPIMKSVLQ